MPMKLSVGFSKKAGLPDYGSIGAMCNVELELNQSLLASDLDGFHKQVHEAYIACSQAVHDELAHHQGGGNGKKNQDAGNGRTLTNGDADKSRSTRSTRSTRLATSSQIRAIHAISARQQVDLAQVLYDRFGAGRPEELSISEASTLIDELKSAASGTGGRR